MPHRTEPLPLSLTSQPVPEMQGALTRRTLAYGALALLLGGGLATRYGSGLAGAPAAMPAQAQLLPFRSLDPAQAEAALAASSIPPEQRAGILAAVRDRRMHLVEAPFFGLGATVGRAVTVASGLVSVPLVLGSEPKSVLLPITRAGTIVVTSTGAGTAADDSIGVVSNVGPVNLPAPDSDHTLQIDVIVQ